MAPDSATDRIRDYWNERIHDLEMTDHPVGTPEFFADLDDYRFDKLRYLPQLVDFDGYRGQRLLEVGCGIGTDLVRFARGGAQVVGIDLAAQSVALARTNADLNGVGDRVELRVADGESMWSTRTVCCNTRRTLPEWSPSAGACCALGGRRSSWSTTACRG